ncbi:hypothetical protein SH1V18_44200 [Vallitalea longa]|uniref:DUF4177 domain-containing protein n=1 Tax=Vallitalea longa TaxID=2936439 RepID=A0A9W5YG90_9FIRM|nr:DUF4177 domain-containing protein [Vallitalea longa]GKX31940.1 hypothetical protein SH1V18_44200 [Vallitalea longa]
MKKWEYLVLKFDSHGITGGKVNTDEIENKLNRLGKDGWEVATTFTTNQSYGNTLFVVYTLKREIE